MRKFALIILMSVALTATADSKKVILQTDIDAGAVPLTSSQITSAFTNNTVVGSDWTTYYAEGKKRIVLHKKKIHKRKWKVSKKKGFCFQTLKNKKWFCAIVWKIGPKTYRVYDEEGRENWSFKIEKGNIHNLK